jgi:hypothetical protein
MYFNFVPFGKFHMLLIMTLYYYYEKYFKMYYKVAYSLGNIKVE